MSDATNAKALEAALLRAGLKLSEAEQRSVASLAVWLDDGIGKLRDIAAPESAGETPEPASASDDGVELSIMDAASRLRDGSLTAVALTRAHLARIAERNPTYLAFYEVLAERALADAARADAELANGQDRGLLHGIPVGVKDLIDVAGIRTSAGSAVRADHVAAHNAPVIERLIEAGAVIIGKLATYEFATVGPAFDTLFPPAKNPWRIDHITGGSSSGCASAVAGGLVRTSIGTDTGGSLRSPAAYCGIVGLKPTFGLVPGDGIVPLSPSLDHVGPVSASVAEAAITLDILSGRAGEASSAASMLGHSIEGMRIGYARDWSATDKQADPLVLDALDEAVSQLSLLGAVIEEVTLPDYQLFEAAGAAILHAEAFALYGKALADTPERFGRKTYQTLASGVMLSDADLFEALRAGGVLRDRVDAEIFSRVDVVVCASTLSRALPVAAFGKEAVWTPMRTIAFNVTGHPALALPIAVIDGLPVGMQIAGRYFEESQLCRVGDAYERATGGADRHAPWPPVAVEAPPGDRA